MKHVKIEEMVGGGGGGGKNVCPKFILCTVSGFTLVMISNKNMVAQTNTAKVTGAFLQMSVKEFAKNNAETNTLQLTCKP
jgi:hypothetical protein